MLPDSHHLLHEAPIEAIAGQHRQDPIPIQKVVVNASLNETQHAVKHTGIPGDRWWPNPEQSAELAIHLLITMPRKRESHGSGYSAIAFNNVAVVPNADCA